MDKLDPERIGNIIENFIGGIVVFDYDTQTRKLEFQHVNDGLFRMLGITKDAGMMLMKNFTKTVLPEDRPILRQWIKDVVADNGSVDEEIRYVNLEGQLAWASLRGNLFERKGSVNTIVCGIFDITEKKTIEEEFRTQFEFMNTLMAIGINFDFNVRTDVCEIKVGKGWETSGNMLIDHYLERVEESGIHPDDRETFMDALRRAMKKPIQDSFEYRAVPPFSDSQDYKWLKCNILSITGNEGYVSHVLGLVSDINEQKLEELELKLRADKDSLTGLMNKGATEELIKAALEEGRKQNKNCALILLDVDDFKQINDTLGHASGDEALAFVGKVLQRNFKGMDVVGRIGGDEFMIFMGNINSPKDVEGVATKLEKMIQNDCSNEKIRQMLSASIGIVTCPENGWEFEKLYQYADEALYKSKEKGKATYSVYGA